ncbi:MAG TPA: YwhD family protein [Longimicrobiales bacterium]
MIEGVPEDLRVQAAPAPATRVSLHAVLVRDGEAHFDDGALHGRSLVEAGIEWVGSKEELEAPERWGVVWVAVTHDAGGSRAYSGLVANELWVDPLARRGFKDLARHVNGMDEATNGRVDLGALRPGEREALRRALVAEDPEAWDRASLAVVQAFRSGTRPPG